MITRTDVAEFAARVHEMIREFADSRKEASDLASLAPEHDAMRREIDEARALLMAGPGEHLVAAVKRTLLTISNINGIHGACGARPGIDDVTAKVLELRRRAEALEEETERLRGTIASLRGGAL